MQQLRGSRRIRKRVILGVFFFLITCIYLSATATESSYGGSVSKIIGNVSNPLVSEVLNACTGISSINGIIVDARSITSKSLKDLSTTAVYRFSPIILIRPTKQHILHVTGIELDSSDLVMIFPQENGREFSIYRINTDSTKIFGLSRGSNRPYADAIRDTVKKHDATKKGQPIENSHRRWTVLDVQPLQWGNQGQWIHVGFQYDLYYVCNPRPAKKYLLMRTIGTGVSSGKPAYDGRFHRGFFQNKVVVQVDGYGHDGWTGEPLILVEYAPQSENSANEAQSTAGVLFSLSGIAGIASFGNTAAGNSGVSAGVSLYDQQSVATRFDDFAVSFLAHGPKAVRWEFWMNGAEGSKIRKKRQTWDLLSNRYGIFTVRELPDLANGSVLQPDVQALYVTHGEQKGKWIIQGTVEHHLRKIYSRGIYYRTKKLSKVYNQQISINFSQISGEELESCKD